ncbi:undecaprenyl-phosphate galactose phosphotransferase WbaP [Lonepinella koalarum]|uniref:undecaprenyl-phosphate galactose phosphotransferase WbaP n=1 Tax=Lonepinella TaxID=53416 RepID=UPI0011E4B2EE|nr:undecaprenyl-phosphate galactose phosphotransferase WbaP [Lonepinella koalarum]TYG33819.1 undecaprenyl-phosphate galactose phosphotransferase WbaP [Lonepinella koalarum]
MNKVFFSKTMLSLTDFFSIFISFLLSLELLSLFTGEISRYVPNGQLDDRLIIHLALSIFGVAWFWIRLRHYTYRKPFWFELKEVIRTLLILAIFELAIIAFSKLDSSRYLWVLTWFIALVLVPLFRVMVKKFLISSGYFIRDTIIIGTGNNAVEAYNALKSESYLGFNIKGFVETGHNEVSVLESSNQIYLDNEVLSLPRFNNIQYIIALEDNEIGLQSTWLRELSIKNCRFVSIIPTLRGLPLYSTDMSFLFSHDVMLLRINNNLAKRSSRCLKRTMDILFSILIIIGLSPLLLTLYFLIKKDGGNAIYGHERIGRNGKPFKCLKFRSMVTNSKEILENLLENDPEARAEWEKDFKLKNDPRITKVGKFIRKTSLDELPQLFNVLKGEMSLVGPRPVIQEELERYNADVNYYLMAKPGMTGLWQVSGRNDVDYDTRVYFDSWYVKNWSLWNDIAILFKTVNVVLKRDGAY